MHCLGIKIDNLATTQALKKVANFLDSDKQQKIFTPNPEMIVDAQEDSYFKEVLNSGDLNICDGKGVELFSKEKINRIPGTDFMLEICKIAEEKNKSVFFLGSGSREVLNKLIEQIKIRFPNLKIAGSHPGQKITTTQ